MAHDSRGVTRALLARSGRDVQAASELLPVVYDKLRALAGRYMRGERVGHTLQPTALVHEAYIRLVDRGQVDWQGKTHFFAVAATQMRRVLAEYARARGAQKRGSGGRKITIDSGVAFSPGLEVDVLALEAALEKLCSESPRQGRVVELRFFGGLSVEETAQLLGVSGGTVKGDWRVARAWLARELAAPAPGHP